MASRSFHALFLRARDQYIGSGRWMSFAVLTLVLLHVAILAPFIEESLQETAASSEIERLDTVSNGLSELHHALQAAGSAVRPAIQPALDGLADNLAHDLERLEATRRQILAAAREQDTSTQAESTGGGAIQSGAIRAGATGDGTAPSSENAPELRVRPFLLDDPDWIADIRDARGREEMLAALSPIVDALINEPRYFDANRIWKEKGMPAMKARLDGAAALIPRLRGRFPEGTADWEALVSALSRSTRVASELQLAPPDQPFWWTRERPGEELELGLTADVKLAIHAPAILTELSDAVATIGNSHRALTGRVAAARNALGESSGGGRIAGVQLAVLAPMFPLVIGLLVAAVMIRRSSHLRELGLSTRLAIEHGGPAALHRWLLGQVQWSSAVTATAVAWRRCLIQTLLGYFLVMGWIAVAADQLRQLRNLDPQRLVLFTIAGATLILVAVAHRLLIVRQAIAISQGSITDPEEIETSGTFAPAFDAASLGAASLDAASLDAASLDAESLDAASLDAASLDAASAESVSPEKIPAEPVRTDDDPIDSQPLKR